MAQRRQSAPSIVIRGVLGRSLKAPSGLNNRGDSNAPYSPNVNSQRLSLKFGSHGATLNLSKRKYVMEGKVQLTTGMQTQDRYMFLFTDLLLIAKAKSGSNFKLKYRIRVCELWIASCLDDVCELPKSSDKSFVIGWPTTNYVATFSTPESKELWLSALVKKIHEEKEKESPKTTTLKVLSRDLSNSRVKMITVSHKHTARDVVRLAVKEFGLESGEDEYQLWVMSRKEEAAYPLIGHENPHAIQIGHIRDVISSNGILQETEMTSIARYESLIQSDIRNRCQFILRSSRQSPKYNVDVAQKRMSRLKAKTPAIFNWARKRSGQRNESSDSGHVSGNSVGSDGATYFSSSPPSTSPPATPKLFSLPLGQVCENGELPRPVASMLDILYRKAPQTSGIFRKSANAKTTRQLKHKLDEEVDVTMNDVSIHVIAALVKDFLRNIPDSVLDSSLFSKWTEVIDIPDDEEKIKSLRSLLSTLDSCNRILIRRLAIVLNRIASRAKRNNMTSYNLAVCIAPSLLWPPGPVLQTQAPMKVTEILQFFTDHCHEVFDGIVPTDVDWPPEIDFQSNDDDNDDYEGDNEKSTGTIDGSVSPISDGAQAPKSDEQEAYNEEKEEESDVNHFSRSRMIRRQLQRRKPGSKVENTRLLSLSQDSLDRVLNDETLTGNSIVVDDMNLHSNSRTHRRGHRGTDACSMSNDSGFTTLSGEDEDAPYSGKRISKEPAIPMSSSTGSNLNELSEALEENIRITSEELRRLWAPSLLKISNGQIVEEEEFDLAEKTINEERAETTFGRRQSQPTMTSHRRRLQASSVGSTADRNNSNRVPGASSRLVEGMTSPTIEYDESDDELVSPFRRQPPTYVRLNDNHDKTDDEKVDTLAQEYLRQLRKLSTDDVTENISKTVTSSENKKQYLSGVTVTVNDVRPPEVRQYRPVTLSIRGITEGNLSPPGVQISDRDPLSATSEEKTFFIGDDHSSGGTSDALSSSQEDVFKSWDGRSSLREPRSRIKTTSELEETPKTAPLSRKYNSVRSHSSHKVELDSPSTPDSWSITADCLSPIQKLTENLQLLPDFRQQSITSKNSEESVFLERKKGSSLREGRHLPKGSVSTHYAKGRSLMKADDALEVNGTSFKARTPTASRSSVSDASRSSLESSSRTSLNDPSPSSQKEEGAFDRDARSRRLHGRKRFNLLSKMTNGAENGSFSKSLPASDWRERRRDPHPRVEKRESARESLKSIGDLSTVNTGSDVTNGCDVATRLSRASPKLRETDILHMAGTVESKVRELSSSPSRDVKESTSPVQFQVRAGSVKSKITAFNNLISTPSPSSNSSSSPVEFILRDNHEEFRIKKKSAVATPCGRPEHPKRQQHDRDVTKKRNEDSNRNGLVIRAAPDSLSRKSGSNRMKETVSVRVHPPDDKVSNRRSPPQPVSDNLLFSLSESFAFGNRKSPRNITPSGSPRDSPIFMRRRRTDTRTSRQNSESPSDSITPERRARHVSVDRYTGGSRARTNVHVTSWSTKRRQDDRDLGGKSHRKPVSQTISTRDKNSNEIFPFEKVIHSEESRV